MASVNKVILIGRLGKDPEIRTLQNGGRIANISVATSENWTDKRTGEKMERTEWHRVVIFNEKLAELAEKYLQKGSQAYFEGQLQTRKWTDQAGVERYSTEIALNMFNARMVLLDGRRQDDTGSVPGHSDGGSSKSGYAYTGRSMSDGWTDKPKGNEPMGRDMDDEIPF